MPFTSVLGASSAIRPGVVTSSTRPSVPYTGQTIYETDTGRLAVYNGSAWITQNGLQLVKTQTIGTGVSSVVVSNAFSATYDNYQILVSGGVTSATTRVTLQLGSSATGYYHGGAFYTYASTPTVTNAGGSNETTFTRFGVGDTTCLNVNATITQPFLSTRTGISAIYQNWNTADLTGTFSGFHSVYASYTDFTLGLFTGGATMTGGTIRVYGYANN